MPAFFCKVFLHGRKGPERDRIAEISARDHDLIRPWQQFINFSDSVKILYFCKKTDIRAPGLTEGSAHSDKVVTAADERLHDPGHAEHTRIRDIRKIHICHGRPGDLFSRNCNTLPPQENASPHDGSLQMISTGPLRHKKDLPVIQQDR